MSQASKIHVKTDESRATQGPSLRIIPDKNRTTEPGSGVILTEYVAGEERRLKHRLSRLMTLVKDFIQAVIKTL